MSSLGEAQVHNFIAVCAAWLMLVTPVAVFGETLVGKVVKVADGDTVTVLDADQVQHRVRLAGIDAPESNQPFGQAAKEALVKRVAGRTVAVEWHKRDQYDRLIGKVISDGTDAGLAQVRAGLAWWYRRFATEQTPVDRTIYEDAEAKAKASRRGLWSGPDPVAPWDWCKAAKGGR